MRHTRRYLPITRQKLQRLNGNFIFKEQNSNLNFNR